MSDEEQNESAEYATQVYYSEIMRQLLESERFKIFFQANYDLQKVIDEEAKTFEMRLIEVPHEVVKHRMVEQLVNAPDAEGEGSIVTASEADLKTIERLKG